MIIINKTNIKTFLNITVNTYDDQIDSLIPQFLNSICNSINNDFIAHGYNGKIYESDELIFTSTTVTFDTSVVDISFQAGDFFRIYGTNYNDGLYQILSINSGEITIETSKTMRAETISSFIALVFFPDEFLALISKYVDQTIVNDQNIETEQIDDTKITYANSGDMKSFISQNSNVLGTYSKAFKDSLFKGGCY